MVLSCIMAAVLFASSAPADAALDAAVASLIAPRTSLRHVIEYRSVPHELSKIDPRARLQIKCEPRAWYRGMVELPIEVESSEGGRGRYFVTLCVRTFDSAFVAAAPIGRHQAMGSAAVIRKQIETTGFSDDELLTADIPQLKGMRSRQIIAAGRAITRSMVEALPLVMAGAGVTVRVVKEHVKVSVSGRAREDGWTGGVVDVEVGPSRQRMRARVVDREHVEAVE